ncbi:hypothetical protein OBBRIDRAFT_851453 [Obba rivulosa]|uniref:Uncharacterized protein n=1 Tax=Obba rivulosa TaxID=1052685 RepID=A0A8E2DQY0_9APHY|nr:hypothetical protein OBBRIDRAFT_851453 [Obba rivulosa]
MKCREKMQSTRCCQSTIAKTQMCKLCSITHMLHTYLPAPTSLAGLLPSVQQNLAVFFQLNVLLMELYSQQYYMKKVQPLMQVEITCHVYEEKAIDNYHCLSIVKRLTKVCFNNESEDVRMEIEGIAEEGAYPGKLPMSSVLDHLTAVIKQLLDELACQTGWMHAGLGETGHSCERSNLTFDGDTIKPFIAFLKNVYSKDQRFTHALGYTARDLSAEDTITPSATSAILSQVALGGSDIIDTTSAFHTPAINVAFRGSAALLPDAAPTIFGAFGLSNTSWANMLPSGTSLTLESQTSVLSSDASVNNSTLTAELGSSSMVELNALHQDTWDITGGSFDFNFFLLSGHFSNFQAVDAIKFWMSYLVLV